MHLRVNLNFFGEILVHPVRRQNFAGTGAPYILQHLRLCLTWKCTAQCKNIEKFNVFIFVENYGKEAGQKIQIQVQRWTKVSSFPQISVQSSWNIFICGKWGKRILTGEIHIPLNSETDKSWIISAILLLKISQTGHIANIVNAVQCQSYLSGHNACHEFRCSISRIVNNKGHIKTRWRMLLHISPCKNLTRFLWMRKGDELNVGNSPAIISIFSATFCLA